MLFGVGYTEIVIIVGGGLYLIGEVLSSRAASPNGNGTCIFSLRPCVSGSKDLPHFARLAGRATGRAVSYVSALRNRAFSFAEETELNKVQL
jgi:hypothetical protein